MCLPRAEKGSTFAGKRRGVIYHVPPVSLCLFRGVGAIICFHVERQNVINPNRSLDRICLDLLLPSCFLPALVRLPASALSLHLDVARYAFDETSAHLLNNRTKSVKDSNDRFGINHAPTPAGLPVSRIFRNVINNAPSAHATSFTVHITPFPNTIIPTPIL